MSEKRKIIFILQWKARTSDTFNRMVTGDDSILQGMCEAYKKAEDCHKVTAYHQGQIVAEAV